MKWRDLLRKIEVMTLDQLNSDIVVVPMATDSILFVDHFELSNDQEEDRLADGHPVLVLKESSQQ